MKKDTDLDSKENVLMDKSKYNDKQEGIENFEESLEKEISLEKLINKFEKFINKFGCLNIIIGYFIFTYIEQHIDHYLVMNEICGWKPDHHLISYGEACILSLLVYPLSLPIILFIFYGSIYTYKYVKYVYVKPFIKHNLIKIKILIQITVIFFVTIGKYLALSYLVFIIWKYLIGCKIFVYLPISYLSYNDACYLTTIIIGLFGLINIMLYFIFDEHFYDLNYMGKTKESLLYNKNEKNKYKIKN